MNPLYEAFHERGYDLEQVGSTMFMTHYKSGEVVRSMNHDDIEFFKSIGIKWNESMIRFQISTNEFNERGFHPEAYLSKETKQNKSESENIHPKRLNGKKIICTKQHPINGHEYYWNYSYKFVNPVCPKCGLVVHSEED